MRPVGSYSHLQLSSTYLRADEQQVNEVALADQWIDELPQCFSELRKQVQRDDEEVLVRLIRHIAVHLCRQLSTGRLIGRGQGCLV